MRTPLFLLLAATAIGAATAQPAAACFIAISVETLEAEGVTDPAEIARLQARLERQRAAEAAERARREWRAFRRRMDEEADSAGQRSAAELARDLATSFVPPMFAQLAMVDSCGRLGGPAVLDPAGYNESLRWGENSLLAQRLLASGTITDLADMGNLDRRRIRELPSFDWLCQQETVDLTAAHLGEDFRHAELVRVWARLQRLGFNLGTSDPAIHGPRPYRLLAFSEGRSGSLAISGHARLPDQSLYPARQAFTARQQMRRFLATDAVAQRMIAKVGTVLAATPDDRCPATMREIGAVAEELAAAAHGRQRAGNR